MHSDLEESVVVGDDPPQDLPEMPEKVYTEWKKRFARRIPRVDSFWTNRTFYQVPAKEGLQLWNEGKGVVFDPGEFLDRHGVAAIPGFCGLPVETFDNADGREVAAALFRIQSPRVAPMWARLHTGRKKWAPTARHWFLENPHKAAIGLIPDAVGSDKKRRKDAEIALLFLAGNHGVRQVASTYGPEASAIIEELLDRDPMIIERKAPKRPDLLRVGDLPAVVLATGGRLPDDAQDALIELLSVAEPDHPGLLSLQGSFTGDSIDAFVTALVDQWVNADGPGRHDWMLRGAAAFPGDASTHRISTAARAWARNKQAPALRLCQTLAQIASDKALMTLGHIAATTRFERLSEETNQALDQIAQQRGISREALEDRAVPEVGLQDDGRLDCSFSGTLLTATLDETLQVVLLDEGNKRLKAFPRGKQGDAERTTAKARYDRLKKDVAAVADRQVRRMERAMVGQRRWAHSEAQGLFFSHPLIQHLARGLVWQCEQGAFRIAEDGTLADHQDDTVVLTGDPAVWIAHPLGLEHLDDWKGIFEDYGLLQPFPQLGRPTFTLDSDALQGTTVEVAIPPQKGARIMGVLEARGWQRNGSPVTAFNKALGAFRVQAVVTPGFSLGYYNDDEGQAIKEITLVRRRDPVAFQELDSIDISEVMHDLERLN